MTTNATPDLLCPNCPDDRCAGYHHAVGDPCGCFLLPLACAACGHEDDTHPRAGACDLCPRSVCQPIDAPATLPGEDDEADAFATMNALILPDALGDGGDAPAPSPAPSCPSWCTEQAEHAEEAAEPRGEAYVHRAHVSADGAPFVVDVVAWQWFDRDAVEPARVLTWTQTRDDMTPADARAYAAALMAAAELAGGAA